jgi:hypothetical protein
MSWIRNTVKNKSLIVAVCRAEWLVDVKTMADRIITMRHKLQQGLAKEGTVQHAYHDCYLLPLAVDI